MAKREPLKVKVGDLLLCRSWSPSDDREFLVKVTKATKTAATDHKEREWSLVTLSRRGASRDGFRGESIVRVATAEDVARVKDASHLAKLRSEVHYRAAAIVRNGTDRVQEPELIALLAALDAAIKAGGVQTDG